MNHASLFSGIGGFDLAAQWMGWENKLHCEINPFCRKILNYYWPKAISYEDIKTTDFTIWRGRIDILTGGFPCQPYSSAGKRLGKADERHLWPEMLRAIREIKPRWIVGENVAGLLTWNGGLVFKELCTDLENEGYEVQAFIIPACAVGAPHRRDRVWIVAYAEPSGTRVEKYRNSRQIWKIPGTFKSKVLRQKNRQISSKRIAESYLHRTFSNSHYTGLQGRTYGRKCKKRAESINKQFKRLYKFPRQNWQNFPTQSPVCSGDDGISAGLDFKAVFTGIDKPRKPLKFGKWRNESIKGYGNAVVPQVVYEIFKAIESIEKT